MQKLINLILLITTTLALELKTGKNSLYYHPQAVSVGYVNIEEKSSVYYQYFKTFNASNAKNNRITFFLGHNVSESAQTYGFMGYLPYTLKKNQTSTIGVTLTFNGLSLNNLTDLVLLDLSRGAGFSNNYSPETVSYKLMAADLQKFIEQFMINEDIDPNNTQVAVYAGYEMVRPAMLFAQSANKPVELILENPWLGYTSFSQLYYVLPAYGVTDRKGLDTISNHIYRLQTSDYGKDLEDMTSAIDDMRGYVLNSLPISASNPNMDQTAVDTNLEGIGYFFGDCKSCRAYCSLEKTQWTGNLTIRGMMKKDLVFDISKTLVQDLGKVNGRVLVLMPLNTIMNSIQPLLEENPGFQRGGGKTDLRMFKGLGFYPWLDSPYTMLENVDQWLNQGNK